MSKAFRAIIHIPGGLPNNPLLSKLAPTEAGLRCAATRSLGKVSQIGLAGSAARMKVLENTRFEVQFEATLWGTITSGA